MNIENTLQIANSLFNSKYAPLNLAIIGFCTYQTIKYIIDNNYTLEGSSVTLKPAMA